jgi:hypothetical protein
LLRIRSLCIIQNFVFFSTHFILKEKNAFVLSFQAVTVLPKYFPNLQELSDLYSVPNIVRVVKSRGMRWAGNVARMGEGRGVHRVLVGNPEGKSPMGRPRRRWEVNIKMNLQEVGGGCGDWMELAQDRERWWALVGTVMNFRVI